MIKGCCKCCSILPILVICAMYYGTWYSAHSGSFPFLNLGVQPGFDINSVPDEYIVGKIFLVTGANIGLGFETTKALAQRGGKVVMTCRTEKKCQDAIADMGLTQTQTDNIIVLQGLELSSLESVKRFVKAYKESDLALDVLILNAGVMMCPYQLSEDGIELQMAVNHFGQAALTFGLLDELKESQYNPRIVVVSSLAHFSAPEFGVYLDLEEANKENNYDPSTMYGQSKLANIYFTNELQRRLDAKYPEKNFFVNSIHPGVVATNLLRHSVSGDSFSAVLPYILKAGLMWDSETGALTQVAAAVSPVIEQENIKATYFVPIFRHFPPTLSEKARDTELASKFWDYTVQVLSKYGISTDL
eukprot:TRINITY_DN231_c0_g1_i5.p1 TRINITY_DN231_c0_g1~~TRINITY_DN231_c0_g1_i5.p1  ORF type:complete len:385 (+),score=79.66 TRINITY_DN231_c0_g1_i5:77-1156(+)